MAKSLSLATLCILVLAITFGLANSARVLDDVTPQAPADLPPLPPPEDPVATLPSSQIPAATDTPAADAPALADQPDQPQPNPDDNAAPTDASAAAPVVAPDAPVPDDQPDQPQPNPDDNAAPTDASAAAPVVAPDAPVPDAPAQGASATAGPPEHPAISFFMHDVLGGTQASGRIVTGLIATTDVNGIPFSRPNNQVFPVTNGVPLVNTNFNNLINNNNVPLVAGLTGQQQQSQTVIQNTGTNTVVNGGNNNQAFVSPGQLPSGVSLQKLMFGSVTVIDDELTEGHELGSGVLGKGQGFYLASSLDGESHTMAFTACFQGDHGHEDDTISFFGVHRTASPISQIAVVGGTGKYENAKGYATIETLPQQDQHTTDGVDTIAHISVYLY